MKRTNVDNFDSDNVRKNSDINDKTGHDAGTGDEYKSDLSVENDGDVKNDGDLDDEKNRAEDNVCASDDEGRPADDFDSVSYGIDDDCAAAVALSEADPEAAFDFQSCDYDVLELGQVLRIGETIWNERRIFHETTQSNAIVVDRILAEMKKQISERPPKKDGGKSLAEFNDKVGKIRELLRLNERDYFRTTNPSFSQKTRKRTADAIALRREEASGLVNELVKDFQFELCERFYLDVLEDLTKISDRVGTLQAQIDKLDPNSTESVEFAAERDALLFRVQETPESLRKLVSVATASSRKLMEARDVLFLANIRLVVSIVKNRYAAYHNLREDLFGEGLVGLQKAIDGFDYRLGFAFSTYAYRWIVQSVDRGLARLLNNVYVPVKASSQFWKAMCEFEREHGRKPTNEEIARKMKASPSDVLKIRNATSGYVPIDRQEKSHEDRTCSYEPEDERQSVSDAYDHVELHNVLAKAIGSVLTNERERSILLARFPIFGGDTEKLDEIAERYHITRERVRQIICAAQRKLGQSGLLDDFED